MNQGKEVTVGLVIIVAVVVAVVGTLWLQGTNFGQTTTTVEALLESVGQLSEGNPVTFRGVRIGHVSAIEVEPGDTGVRIGLQLDRDITLPADAGVVLGPESLFGGWQAEIVSRARFPRFQFYQVPPPPPGEAPELPGYTLPELSRLTASAEQISVNLAELTARLELAFNQETADNLSRAIANIEGITQEVRTLVRQQGEIAGSITANADSALAEVESAAQAARRSFERMAGFMDDAQMDTILVNVRIASAGLREVAEGLASDDGLGATLERADSAFVRIDRIAARLESGEGSLGRLLTDSTFAIRAESALDQLSLLLQDVRENPRRYVRLSIF